MFNYIDRTIISILQVPIKVDLGLSDGQLGALTGLSFALFEIERKAEDLSGCLESRN